VSQQQSSSDEGMLIVLAVAAIGIWALWHFFGAQIVEAYFILKKAELLFFWPLASHFEEPQQAMAFMDTAVPKHVAIAQLKDIARIVGFYFNFITAAVLVGATYWAWKKNPLGKFRRELSMDGIMASEQGLWSSIAPVVGLNIIEQDLRKGPWAMSMRPLDFARRYKLLDEENKLDIDRSEKLFASQLGRLWEGQSKMKAPTRALFAIFAAFGNGDRDAANAAIDKLNYSYAAGKPDFSWVKEMLEKHGKHPEVVKVCNSHAYVNTVMASMLERARKMGPLPSSTFIWLKPTNRPLWYTLNGVGRQVAFAEVAGIYGHWVAEKVAEHPLERPYVRNAVKGLEHHFENEIRVD